MNRPNRGVIVTGIGWCPNPNYEHEITLYTDFLEKENKELKEKIYELELETKESYERNLDSPV